MIFETPSFIEFILKYYSDKCDDYNDFNYHWGDKSALYALQIPLLYKYFPDVKFIHIVRDPRDVALSYKKTWNKNIYEAANKWRLLIEEVDRSKKILNKEQYHELYYEDLLMNTENVLTGICSFIGVQYEENMNKLNKITEYFGDAKYSKHIFKI